MVRGDSTWHLIIDSHLLSSANAQKLASSVQEDESSISSLQDDEKKKLSVRTQ